MHPEQGKVAVGSSGTDSDPLRIDFVVRSLSVVSSFAEAAGGAEQARVEGSRKGRPKDPRLETPQASGSSSTPPLVINVSGEGGMEEHAQQPPKIASGEPTGTLC